MAAAASKIRSKVLESFYRFRVINWYRWSLLKPVSWYWSWIFKRDRCLLFKLLIMAVLLFTLLQCTLFFLHGTKFGEHVNPNIVRSYLQCALNNSKLVGYPSKYSCNFQPQPTAKDVLIVTFVNSASLAMARNWICSAEKVGLKQNLYIITFEEGVCAQLPEVACYQHPETNFKYNTYLQSKMAIERTRVILKLLSCRPKIAIVDVDITFLKNPLGYLDSFIEDKDIVFQADSSRVEGMDAVLPYFFNYIWGGFIYMRTNYATRQLWLSVLQYQENFLSNHQAGLNICIRHHTQTVRWDMLDSERFPNGQQYFTLHSEKVDSSDVMVVPADHLEDSEKIPYLIGSNVWCHRGVAVKTCRDGTVCGHSDTATLSWCEDFTKACRDKYGITR